MRKTMLIILLVISTNSFAENIFTKIASIFKTSKYQDEQIDDAIFPSKRPASLSNIFMFDPKRFVWAVYDKNGYRVGSGNASGGKDFCSDIKEPCRTVVGEYTVYRKEDKDCTSKTFPIDEGGGAPMPHCMFFYKGYAIHGSKHYSNNNLSHGCIRVSEKAAEWMNNNYIHEGSLVIVKPY